MFVNVFDEISKLSKSGEIAKMEGKDQTPIATQMDADRNSRIRAFRAGYHELKELVRIQRFVVPLRPRTGISRIGMAI